MSRAGRCEAAGPARVATPTGRGPAVLLAPARVACGGAHVPWQTQSCQDECVPTIVLRSILARATALALAGLAVVTLTLVTARDGLAAVQAWGWCGLAGVAVWALWWAPQARLTDTGLDVRNAWRSYTIPWETVDHLTSRWCLVIHLREGHGRQAVTMVVAQRQGGVATAWNRRAQMREHSFSGRPGTHGHAVSAAVEHRGVRDEYLEPGAQTYRTHLDADSAADLLEAYADRRAAWLQVQARERKRHERLQARRGEAHAAQPAPAHEPGARQPGTVRAHWNVAPAAALVVSVLVILVGRAVGA